MTRHIGAEDLARYRERDLTGRKSARIRAHLTGCPRCVALDEQLAGVTALLASAPAPVMPDQVTARIQAALRAEAARPMTAAAGARAETLLPPPTESGQRGPSRHAAGGAGGRRNWRLPELRSRLAVRALGVATAAAAIAGGAYGVSQLGAAVPGGASSTAAGGSLAGPLRTPTRLTGPALHYAQAGRPATVLPVATGTNFVQQHLASQVAATLRRAGRNLPENQGADITSHPGSHPVPASTGQRRQSFGGIPVGVLQGCVTRISAGRPVLLVDVARYQGRQATVIVVAGGTGGSRVFVVGPGCSGSDSELITQASLPRAG